MMISPFSFRAEHENDSLKKLQRERAELIRYMKKYENHELPEEDYHMCPSPEVHYSMYKDYLWEILELIEGKLPKSEEK